LFIMNGMHYLSAQNLKKFSGKTCLLRVDLNIEPGAPLDNYRLKAAIPTIKLLLKNKVKVVILSHRGRPKDFDKKLSLMPFAPIIAKKISHRVNFCKPGDVVLLENLRFLSGEEKNDAKLAKQLASLGDFYVNDAFAFSHRPTASMVGITKFLPSYAGPCLEKELENLGGIINYTTHPFVIVLGGAKLKEKIIGLENTVKKADAVLLGSNVFNESGIPKSPKIIWPEDAKNHGKLIWDIGPFTANRYASVISKARTIVWNGPPGFFEKKGFEKGTVRIWKAILKNRKARIVIGGGETLASLKLVKNAHVPKNVFLSTGGGAMLEFLSGGKLPGIEALK
jgi:phosphoglycerate kinase